jgi:hypothetical protein
VPGNDSFEDIRRMRERHNRTAARAQREHREAGFEDEPFGPEDAARYPTDEELAAREQQTSARGPGRRPSRPSPSRGIPRPRSSSPANRRRNRPPILPAGAPTLRRPLGYNVPVGAGTGLGGLFLGAIVYALILSVVEYGPQGPAMWFKAKFLNIAAGSSAAGGNVNPASSPPGVPGTTSPAGAAASGAPLYLGGGTPGGPLAPGDILPGNAGQFITGTPPSTPPAT